MGSQEAKRYRLFVRLYILAAGISFGVGGAFLVGRESRFSGDSFLGLRVLAGILLVPERDAFVVWGAVFVCFGLAMVVAFMRSFAVHVLRFGIALNLLLVTGFVQSVFRSDIAAASGIAVYLGIAGLFLLLSDHLVKSNKSWED